MRGRVQEREGGKQTALPWFLAVPYRVVLLAGVVMAIALIYIALRANFSSNDPPRGLSVERAFFIFGDSYADVGNIPSGPAFNVPYGTTWPGHPVGRFSDGYVQTDCIATQALESKSPPAFARSNIKTFPLGANFAWGGAALTHAFGAPTISTQVGSFESVVKSGIYTEEVLASSVTLLCIAGNDYSAYRGSIEDSVAFIEEVVGLIEQSLRKLYSLGLRNIMVTTLAPLNCLPTMTIFVNFTACSSNASVEDVEFRHNSYLETLLATLSKELSGINFILLRQGDALQHIQQTKPLFNISQPFLPCCFGFCGAIDWSGSRLYTVCDNPENHVLWDNVHPTQAAWENVVKLYINDGAYTTFVPTLRHWTQKLP